MVVFRLAFALAALVASLGTSRAAVIVVGNYTLADVPLTITDPDNTTRTLKLAPFQLAPVSVSGPIDVSFPTRGQPVPLRLEPYNAYVLVFDEKAGVRLEGIQLAGDPLPEDSKPIEGPPPKREPHKIPVTLYVDDSDPRADRVWQAAVRKRFEEAAAVVEQHSGIRFEFKGFGTWQSEPMAFEPTGMLEDFTKKVRVKDGELAIGYSSRKVEDKPEIPFGACRGVLGMHVLMRESRPRNEAEKVEALTHYLGQIAGAVLSPDPESVMRPKLGNGLAVSAKYRLRFDPLNTLAMNIWAEEHRKGPRLTLSDLTPANKFRLTRVYKAMAAAMPDDKLAMNYTNELDNALAQGRPKAKPNDPKMAANPVVPPPASERTPQQEAVRQVLLAVVARADLNSRSPALGAEGELTRLRGDALLEAYIQAAADAAWLAEEQFRPTAFLVGLGIALDDADALREDSQTAPFVKAVETDSERQKRLALIGQPTLHARRDLCQRFAVASAKADLTGASAVEADSVKRSLAEIDKPAGFSFPAVAADFAGVEMSQQVKGSPELLSKWRKSVRASNLLPPLDGLRDGLSEGRFQQDFGNGNDARITKVLDDIRNGVSKLPAYRN